MLRLTVRPKPPAFPRLALPPPAYGSPQWNVDVASLDAKDFMFA